jgi:Ser/Thr protein kinase RdoA (MazF antagonist)
MAEAGELGEASGESPAPAPTAWPDFLGRLVAYRHERLADHLPAEDRAVAERLAREARRIESAPLHLLHGDCGAHNFLFRPLAIGTGAAEVGPLRAVLDPYPLVGYPVYDLAFAFVSWPNGLEPEAILSAAEALRDAGRWRPNGEPRRILWEEVLIALYLRMGTCLVYHPKDFPAYLAAWPRWRALAVTQ